MADSGMDISKLVGLIMENPDIIERIRSLTEKSEDARESEPIDEEAHKDPTPIASEEDDSEPTVTAPKDAEKTKHRHELLCALKPYVSKSRAGAIDTVLGVMDVIAIMKK